MPWAQEDLPPSFREICDNKMLREKVGGVLASLYSLDASNQDALNRADDCERSHRRGMECLRCHNHESTEPIMQTGNEQSKSKQEDTDSTHHPETWDGKKGKVSLPDLNEKSTANDAWIWHTDV